MAVRSVRNNNPGNIRTNSTDWVGKSGDDGSFVVFRTPEEGVRAMAKTIETYQNKHGLQTPSAIIGRYAPTSENNTQAYIDAVSNAAGLDPNQPIDLSENPEKHKKFIAAMIKHEGGAEAANYFNQGNIIDNGIRRAIDQDFDNAQAGLDDTEANQAYLDAIKEKEAEGIDAPDESKETPDDPKESTRQILNGATSLAQVIDNMEKKNLFWDNELDQFQNFTYNLELFCVSQQEAGKYLAYDNTPTLLQDVVTDAWPPDNIEKITIAKSGVTTELNITDLNVNSQGYGVANTSRLAGTAISLDFNITQVGGTSLPDMLNNTVLLCGYPNVAAAVFFLKIKFIGYDDNDTVIRNLPATKVLPFKIKLYAGLSSETDARGTSTRLEGTIENNTPIVEKSIAQVDHNFEFPVKDTLDDTIQEFFSALNNSIVEKSVLSDPNFINEYKFVMSDEFKEAFGQAEMKDPENPNMASGNNETDKKKAIKIGLQTGIVTPGISIYNALESIIFNAKQIREELTESKDKATKLFTVIPHGEPKLKGYNVLTGKYSYIVTYYIHLQKTFLPKNQIDNANLVASTAKILKDIFLDGRCHKRYYNTYTGKNDQILDFRITLTEQLQKTYSQPADSYMANVFLDQIGDYRKLIDKKAQQKLTELEAEAGVLQKEFEKQEQESEQLIKDFNNLQNKLKSKFLDRLRRSGINGKLGGLDSNKIRNADIVQLRNFLQTSTDANSEQAYEILEDILKGETRKNFNTLNNAVRKAQLATNEAEANLEQNQREEDETLRTALGHMLSNRALEATSAMQDSWENLGLGKNDNGDPGIVLTEELDKEIIKKLSIEQFSSLMKTLIENPVNFARITKPLLEKPTKLSVIKSPNQEDIELAQEKYYEGKAANLSMMQATITIKGDPYWIETFLPVEVEKGNYGTSNSLDQYRAHSTQLNGQNHIVIITDKAEGNFLENSERIGQDAANSDGIKKTRLETSIYVVKEIQNSFSGGRFTQTMNLVKQPSATVFKEFKEKMFDNTPYPEFYEDRIMREYYTNIPDELGVNEGKNEGSEAAEKINNSNVGTGTNTSEDVDGDGVPDKVIVGDPSDGYFARNGTLLASLNSFLSNTPASEADSKALMVILNEMEGRCLAGSRADCVAVQGAFQEMTGPRSQSANATEMRNNLNEIIDDGDSVSPAYVAVLDKAYEGLGEARIQDGVVNISQDEIDSWTSEMEKNTRAYTVGNNDMIFDHKSALQNIEPNDTMGTTGTEALLNGDIELSNKGIRARQEAIESGTGGFRSRSYEVDIEPNTLTTQELNNVSSLNAEAQNIIAGRSLMDLTDEEYTRVKTIERTVDDINTSATTGTRGEIRDSLEAERLKSQIEKDEAELKETNDDLDSWYWTKKGRRDDEERKAELEKSIADNRASLQSLDQDPVSGIVSSKDANGELVHTPIQEAVKVTDPDVGNIPVKVGDNNRVDIVTQDGIENYQQGGDAVLSDAQVAEYKGASSVYNQIIEQANNKPKITITDEYGTEEVLDYSNLSPISYQDENGNTVTIQNPSTHFGLVDTSKGTNDIERYQLNSTTLKDKVASSDNFPNVETSSTSLSSTDRNDSEDVLRGEVGKNDFIVVAQERNQEQTDGPQ